MFFPCWRFNREIHVSGGGSGTWKCTSQLRPHYLEHNENCLQVKSQGEPHTHFLLSQKQPWSLCDMLVHDSIVLVSLQTHSPFLVGVPPKTLWRFRAQGCIITKEPSLVKLEATTLGGSTCVSGVSNTGRNAGRWNPSKAHHPQFSLHPSIDLHRSLLRQTVVCAMSRAHHPASQGPPGSKHATGGKAPTCC